MQTKNLLGGVKLWKYVMRLFSLLYHCPIAASHTVHVHYFSCVMFVVIYFNTLIFFSINIENVRECCKVQ